MTANNHASYRTRILGQWIAATDEALDGLRAFRERLVAWAYGAPAELADLELAFGLLDVAGLNPWYEETPIPCGIDVLAEALEGGGNNERRGGDGSRCLW